MHKSIQGVFRNGKVELLEPAPTQEDSRVLVTFVSEESEVDLQQRGISPAQAQELQSKLKPMNEDWNRPEMDVYDQL